MDVTTPDNLAYADNDTDMSVQDITAAMQTSVQAALNRRELYTYSWADQAARLAETTMVESSRGFQQDTKVEYRYNGTAWVPWDSGWFSYVGNVSGFNVGTGGQVESYEWRYDGGQIRVRYNLKLGTISSSVPGNPVSIALPFPAVALAAPFMIYEGLGGAMDFGSAFFPTVHLADSTSVTRVRIYVLNPGVLNISPTSPFTWAQTDVLAGGFIYQPA